MAQIGSIPLPQQTPIERAGWNTDFSAGGLLTPANNERTPVNPIDIANQQAVMQSQNALRGAQTAGAASDAMQKQRSFQLSMLNGVMALPPEQQADALTKVVPMMNRMGPTQFDENMTPSTARMYMMSNVPTEQLPMYQMNTAKANFYQGIANAANGQPPQAPPAPNSPPGAPMPQDGVIGSPKPAGVPMPQNGVIGGGAAPIPSGGGQPVNPTDLFSPGQQAELAVFDPAASQALTAQKKLGYESPEGKKAIAAGEAQGKNTTEAQNNAIEANEGYQQVKQSISALKNLIGTTDEKGNFVPNHDLPQSSWGVPSKSQAWISQNFPKAPIVGDNQAASNVYNTFSTINEAQSINAIRSLADTGQIRMTRTLENIINRGYLVDPDASPQAKMQQANAVETELENSAIAAQNVASKLSGGQGSVPYKTPYTAPIASQQQTPQAQANQPQKNQQNSAPPLGAPHDARLAPDGKWYSPDPLRHGKYLQW